MEYIIIGLLGLLIVLMIVLMMNMNRIQKNQQNDDLNKMNVEWVERLSQLENKQYQQLTTFKDQINQMMKTDFDGLNQNTEKRLLFIQEGLHNGLMKLSKSVQDDFDKLSLKMNQDFTQLNQITEKRLLEIDEKVNRRLEKSFEKTNEAFAQMLARLAKIDEAQKNIESLSQNIVSLQNILGDKKTRGTFGEVQLGNILDAVFGKNDQLYQLQYKMPNNLIVDAILKTPEPLGMVAIDSKFPLENYSRMSDRNLSDEVRVHATKLFASDVKKHIDDIADKYIIDGFTSNQAMMFVPAEAVFAEINAYFPQLIEYSQKRRVWLVSPTTLMSTLTTVQVVVQNLEQAKYAKEIQEQLSKLEIEFDRYRQRWGNLSQQVSKVYKTTQDIHTTTDKITKRFEHISKVNFDELKELDLNQDDEE